MVSDGQLARIRKGRRRESNDTYVKITVHTEPELVSKYYEYASPIVSSSKKRSDPFKDHPVKSRSRSRSSRRSKSKYRSPSLHSRSKRSMSPRKILKIKTDNTYSYKLPPYVIEQFWKHLLSLEDTHK